MLYLSPRQGNSRTDICKVRAEFFPRSILAVFLFAGICLAQEIQSPPVSAFKPDTLLPKVNIPEFVIVGKIAYEVPRANKPSVEFDSTYFQNRQMMTAAGRVHYSRTLSDRYHTSISHGNNLLASLGFGHYQSTSYLLTGAASYLGYKLNGGISGYYTSGFEDNTMERNFMLQFGVTKNFLLFGGLELSPLLRFSFHPSSFYLYGSGHKDLLRKVGSLQFGLSGSTDFSNHPASMSLSFSRYSVTDSISVSQYEFGIGGESLFDLSDGHLRTSIDFSSGEHNVPDGRRAHYLIKVSALYEKKFSQFVIGTGFDFYQYRDDFSSGVGKFFPGFMAVYKLSENNSIYLKYNGEIEANNLSSIIIHDRYLNALSSLKYSERYFNLIIGSDWNLNERFSLTPEASLSLLKYLPTYYSDSTNDNFLRYSSKASISSLSLKGKYHTNSIRSEASMVFRLAKADSLKPVPNLPSFQFIVSGEYTVSPEFHVSANFTFIPSRYSDIALSRKVSDISLLDGRLSYMFKVDSTPLEAFLDIHNLLNQTYFIWQGFQEFPLTLVIGVRTLLF